MKNKGVDKKKEDITKEWGFRDITPTEQERKELLARVAEIGLRVIYSRIFVIGSMGKCTIRVREGL